MKVQKRYFLLCSLCFLVIFYGCECRTDNDCNDDSVCFDGLCAPETSIDMCEAAGGEVGVMICCCSSDDFPNLCVVGACSCPPEECYLVLACYCPEGECWNGVEDGCIPESNYSM